MGLLFTLNSAFEAPVRSRPFDLGSLNRGLMGRSPGKTAYGFFVVLPKRQTQTNSQTCGTRTAIPIPQTARRMCYPPARRTPGAPQRAARAVEPARRVVVSVSVGAAVRAEQLAITRTYILVLAEIYMHKLTLRETQYTSTIQTLLPFAVSLLLVSLVSESLAPPPLLLLASASCGAFLSSAPPAAAPLPTMPTSLNRPYRSPR